MVVGTRSAVFAPLRSLGLIILDEEQEGSYKSEQVPKYHARDVAKYRCAQTGALLVLGLATPSIESMYQARQGVYHLFTLRRRYNERALPQVQIADLREELERETEAPSAAPCAPRWRKICGGASSGTCFSTGGAPAGCSPAGSAARRPPAPLFGVSHLPLRQRTAHVPLLRPL